MASLICPRCHTNGRDSSLVEEAQHCLGCTTCFCSYIVDRGVVVLDDGRRHTHLPGHGSPPLRSLDSAFVDLTFYQLLVTLDRLLLDRPQSILVVGCDTGREFGLLARVCSTISAVDISFQSLMTAAEEHMRLGLKGDVVLYDGESLPYRDQSFDLVVAHHVLHHIPVPNLILNEMWRVCSREALIYEPAATTARKVVLALGLRPRIEADGSHVHDFSIPGLRRFAKANGASFTYSLCFYPRPQGSVPKRWHRAVDRLRLRRAIQVLLGALNGVAGRLVGTKVTASFNRMPTNSYGLVTPSVPRSQ